MVALTVSPQNHLNPVRVRSRRRIDGAAESVQNLLLVAIRPDGDSETICADQLVYGRDNALFVDEHLSCLGHDLARQKVVFICKLLIL
jgi:hypothetical protein